MAIAAMDSPGTHSNKGETNRGSPQILVSRGDSLVYSEDSQDQRSLLSAAVKASAYPSFQSTQPIQLRSTGNSQSQREYIHDPVLKRPCCQNKAKNSRPVDESLISQDSLHDKGKTACCVIQ